LASRAGGVIAVTVALAIALALLLAFLKFDQRLLDVTAARLGLVVEEVRRQAETGLALGLELAELEDLNGVLQRAAEARNVLHLDIADDKGVVLFSSEPGRVGSQADLAGRVADASGQRSRRIQSTELLLTARLINGFGQVVGDVAAHADLTRQHLELQQVRRELMWSAVPVIAIALLLTLLAVVLTVRLSRGAGGEPDNPMTQAVEGGDPGLPPTGEARRAGCLAPVQGGGGVENPWS